MKKPMIGPAMLCLAVALSAGAASAAGVFLRGDGSSVPAVSVRGETYEYAATGIYKYNAQRIVAEGVGWDLVTLILVVPAMLFVLPLLARGSLRGRLIALGLLTYFFYQYLEYAVFWAFGPLFLLFVAIYAGSLAGIIWILSTLDIPGLAGRFSGRFPRRGMAALSGFLTLVLLGMWVPLVAGAMAGKIQGVLYGSSTLVVQALDLGLIVPLAAFTAVSAWLGRPVGYLLCSVLAVKAVTMGSALCAMILNVWIVSGKLEDPPLVIFGCVVVVAAVLGFRMYRSVSVD
jgi:hypothetical protein